MPETDALTIALKEETVWLEISLGLIFRDTRRSQVWPEAGVALFFHVEFGPGLVPGYGVETTRADRAEGAVCMKSPGKTVG